MKPCKKALAIASLFFLSSLAFAQYINIKPVEVPSVKAPSVPEVSVPGLDNGFYTPGNSDFYSGVKKPQTPKAPDTTQKEKPADTSPAASSSTNEEVLNRIYQAAGSSLTNHLTAGDLSGLDSMGLIGNFSSLFAGKTGSSTLNSTTTDSLLLEQILRELNEVKEKVGTQNIQNAQSSAQPKASNPKILRFIVNGFDIASSCRQVYFSTTESDGSFLFTSDRKYLVKNQVRTETFYILFHATGNNSGITNYNVTPEIFQEVDDPNSPVYQFCQHKDFTATRTGNLIKLTNSRGDTKVNLLLSLD